MKKIRQWWQTPRLRNDEEMHLERKVSWLELFFDLVYVISISQLTHELSHHLDLAGFARFVLFFLPIWFSWLSTVVYVERFETTGLEMRLIFFMLMIPASAMAVYSTKGTSETSSEFAMAYSLSRAIMILLWVRAGYHDQKFRPISIIYFFGFSLGLSCWLISIFMGWPWRFLLWCCGLFIDYITPLVATKYHRKMPRFSRSKFPERFGLFVIIMLGESLVGVIRGLAENHPPSIEDWLYALVGMFLTFGLWWIYFDFVARRTPKADFLVLMTWVNLHPLLMMSIVTNASALLTMVTDPLAASSKGIHLALLISLGFYLLIVGGLESTLERPINEPTHQHLSVFLKILWGVVLLLLAVSGLPLSLFAVLIFAFGSLITQMAYGAYVWFSQQENKKLDEIAKDESGPQIDEQLENCPN